MPPSASEVAASDAGPLMALGTLDRLDLLARLFRRTLVAQAVLDECLARPDAADARAIRAAADAGLRVVGTLGLLVQAKRRGWLPYVAPCIERLHAAGRYLSAAAIDAALAAAGEPGA